MKKLFSSPLYVFLPVLFIAGNTTAQTPAPISPSLEMNPGTLQNPLFYWMSAAIIFLFILIMGLAALLNNLVLMRGSTPKNKQGISPFLLMPVGMLSASVTFAQEASRASESFTYGGLDASLFYVMLGVIVIELIVVIALLNTIRSMMEILGVKTQRVQIQLNWEKLSRNLNDAVPAEKEAEITMDHDYDGIKELDNNLPPWWKYGFYLTIFFSFVYLFNYHIAKTWNLSDAEYRQQLSDAAMQKAEYLRIHADMVDENTVKLLTDKESIGNGKDIFIKNCVACHGSMGEGSVGPNLTDNFWIHGGGIQNIFKTIKYGVPEKGMISWQSQLKPKMMQDVASYIHTLTGTNPPNPKAPEGMPYVAPVDSSHAKSDSVMAKQITAQR